MRATQLRHVLNRDAAQAWAAAARHKRCALCGAVDVKGHHVITQQQLRRTAREYGLPFERLRWDRRNLLALCERHHTAHHSAAHRISLSLVERSCPKVRQFARELGLEWWLERTYTDG